MIWLVVAAIALPIIALIAGFLQWYTDHDFWWIVVLFAGIFSLMVVPVPFIVNWSADHAETTCYQIGAEVDRDVKFSRPSSFVWACLTPSDGGWVEIGKVLKVED